MSCQSSTFMGVSALHNQRSIYKIPLILKITDIKTASIASCLIFEQCKDSIFERVFFKHKEKCSFFFVITGNFTIFALLIKYKEQWILKMQSCSLLKR